VHGQRGGYRIFSSGLHGALSWARRAQMGKMYLTANQFRTPFRLDAIGSTRENPCESVAKATVKNPRMYGFRGS